MIVWLASYPKSGNTWLRKFLQAYLCGPPFRLNEYHPRFRGDLQKEDYQTVSRIPITELGMRDQLSLRHAALFNLERSVEGHIYLKTHHSLTSQFRVEMIPVQLSAGAVYITRDPRDLVISYAHHFGLTIDDTIKHIAKPNNTIFDEELPVLMHGLGSWEGHVRLWLERDYPLQRIAVKYENMVRRPHTTFRQIVKFLGLERGDQRFNEALSMTRFKQLQKQEQERGFTEKSRKNSQFFRRGQPGEWKDVLTDKQVRQIEEDHGEMMRKMEYELGAINDSRAA